MWRWRGEFSVAARTILGFVYRYIYSVGNLIVEYNNNSNIICLTTVVDVKTTFLVWYYIVLLACKYSTTPTKTFISKYAKESTENKNNMITSRWFCVPVFLDQNRAKKTRGCCKNVPPTPIRV